MTMMLRVVLILVSAGTLAMVLNKIRRARLQIEDSIFWVLVSVMFVIFSLFPPVADFLSHLLGIYATVNFLSLFIIFLLLLRVFSMTIRISQLETKVKELIQSTAITRLEQEEAQKAGAETGCGMAGAGSGMTEAGCGSADAEAAGEMVVDMAAAVRDEVEG